MTTADVLVKKLTPKRVIDKGFTDIRKRLKELPADELDFNEIDDLLEEYAENLRWLILNLKKDKGGGRGVGIRDRYGRPETERDRILQEHRDALAVSLRTQREGA